MEIRKATEKDILEIVSLMKLSLGESLMPKTECFWRWKHVLNPFGASTVLVAEDKGSLIGLRAFMNWRWRHQDKYYEAVRAVDTATHPDHQGKGIFKRLTLAGLEELKLTGKNFVFNTPNEKSKPGYLKMGWEEQGRMSLKVRVNPFAFKGKQFISPRSRKSISLDADFFDGHVTGIHTHYSNAYLNWRYADNPMFDYHFITDNLSYFMAYRYKLHSFGIELRIVDLLVNKARFSGFSKQQLRKQFKEVSAQVFLISASGNHYTSMLDYYPKMGILPVLKKGPVVTLRNIGTSSIDFTNILLPSNWSYSIGDLELF